MCLNYLLKGEWLWGMSFRNKTFKNTVKRKNIYALFHIFQNRSVGRITVFPGPILAPKPHV